MQISNGEMLLRFIAAALLGSLFGHERQCRNKPVGMRTYVIIAITACAVSLISVYGFEQVLQHKSYSSDPARLVVGMLTGVGFLGAGIIWRGESGHVEGITTAAVVLFISMVGIACGLGLYLLAGLMSGLAYLALVMEKLLATLRRHLAKLKAAFDKHQADKALAVSQPAYTATCQAEQQEAQTVHK